MSCRHQQVVFLIHVTLVIFYFWLVDFPWVVTFDELSFNEVSGTDQYVYEIPVSLQNSTLINSYFLSPWSPSFIMFHVVFQNQMCKIKERNSVMYGMKYIYFGNLGITLQAFKKLHLHLMSFLSSCTNEYLVIFTLS